MKKTILLGTLSLTALCADFHEPSVSLNVDAHYPVTLPTFHLGLTHQSTFELEDSNVIILHALVNPYSHKVFYNEVGVGFRRIFENFGFGTNILVGHQICPAFQNFQLIPGLELFYDHFGFSYNRYLPIKTSLEFMDVKYLFHDVSEVSLSYRPSKKYEFSLSPYFNHQTERFGMGGTVSAYIFDDFKLSLMPYFAPKEGSGVAFSIGYHFGGPKGRANSPINKSRRFFYTSNKEEVERFTPPFMPILMPSPAPVILKPAIYDPANQENKPETPKNWWDFLIPVQSKKG